MQYSYLEIDPKAVSNENSFNCLSLNNFNKSSCATNEIKEGFTNGNKDKIQDSFNILENFQNDTSDIEILTKEEEDAINKHRRFFFRKYHDLNRQDPNLRKLNINQRWEHYTKEGRKKGFRVMRKGLTVSDVLKDWDFINNNWDLFYKNYHDRYSDLQRAFKGNKNSLRAHYFRHGRYEGRGFASINNKGAREERLISEIKEIKSSSEKLEKEIQDMKEKHMKESEEISKKYSEKISLEVKKAQEEIRKKLELENKLKSEEEKAEFENKCSIQLSQIKEKAYNESKTDCELKINTKIMQLENDFNEKLRLKEEEIEKYKSDLTLDFDEEDPDIVLEDQDQDDVRDLENKLKPNRNVTFESKDLKGNFFTKRNVVIGLSALIALIILILIIYYIYTRDN